MLFSNILDRLRVIPWRSIFEYTKTLKRFLIRISLVATGFVNKETAIICHVFGRTVLRLYRQMGPLSTSLYLKQCSVSLMRYYAGLDKQSRNQMVGIYVSLCRSGIPTIIPKHHRALIRARGERGNRLVQLYLSLFSVCRIIKLAKPVKASLFNSITTPIKDITRVIEVMSLLKQRFKVIMNLYLPHLNRIPLKPGFRFVPTWKATPNDDRGFCESKGSKIIPTIFTSFKYEIAAFALQLRLIHSFEGVFSPGILFKWGYNLYPFDISYNTKYANEALTYYESWPGLVFDNLAEAFASSNAELLPGRLAQVIEGAGKRRLFVIGNYFKQRLLHPVHEWAMKILRSIPTDGTFNQEGPIRLLVQRLDLTNTYVESLDLSSATDRWPVSIIHDYVACIFGPTMASCIVNGCLALNSCSIKNIIGKQKNICFVAGQPLGYYGSWALFSLSHHFMVWLAADKVDPNRKRPFNNYALLGDDIVIADREVSREYRSILNQLQVQVSDAKSLVSEIGAFEFAKQFWLGKINLSPVSAKAVLASYSVTGITQIARKYNLSLKTCLKLGGAGYRVKALMDTSKMSKRYQRLSVLCQKHQEPYRSLPIEWWIGRGQPISPFLKGILIAMGREQTRLKDLRLVPEERFWGDGELWTTENQLYRSWMADWLKYLKWYTILQSSPDPSFEFLFSPPIISFTWRRLDNTKNEYYRLISLVLKFYNKAEGKDCGWCPRNVLEKGRTWDFILINETDGG